MQMFDDKKAEELGSDYCKLKKVYISKTYKTLLPRLEARVDVLQALECADMNQLFKKYLRVIEGMREEERGDFNEDKARTRVDTRLSDSVGDEMVEVDVTSLVDESDSAQLGEIPPTGAGRRFSLWRLRRRQGQDGYTWLSDAGFVFVFHQAQDVRELCLRRGEHQEEEPEELCVTIKVRLGGGQAPPVFVHTFDVQAGGEEAVRDFVGDWRGVCGFEGFENHVLECVEVDGLVRVLRLDAQSLGTFIPWLNLAAPGSVSAVVLQVTDTSSMEVEAPSEIGNADEWEGDWRKDIANIGVFAPQKDVAERIMCRMKHVLAKP